MLVHTPLSSPEALGAPRSPPPRGLFLPQGAGVEPAQRLRAADRAEGPAGLLRPGARSVRRRAADCTSKARVTYLINRKPFLT